MHESKLLLQAFEIIDGIRNRFYAIERKKVEMRKRIGFGGIVV